MANAGDPRLTAAGASIKQEPPVVPPPPREIPTAPVVPNIPPPRFGAAPNMVNLTEENQPLVYSLRYYDTLTDQERETCMQSLFNLMTSNEEDGAAQFRGVVSSISGDIPRMALSLTSDPDRFLEMARNENGSSRIQKLLGRSDDADIFFFNAITSRFVNVMTDYDASRVGLQGMRVFSQERRQTMYDYVLENAFQLACTGRGYAVLKKIIDGLGNSPYRDQLLDIVAQNALNLSYHPHGNYVVQHALELNDLRCTHNIAFSLSGYCVQLSFAKLGSYVVQKLLDTDEGAVTVVVEFLGRDDESLVGLARSEFGSYVVLKALRVMRERNRMDLFGGLVNKLMPYVHRLRGCRVGAYLHWLR